MRQWGQTRKFHHGWRAYHHHGIVTAEGIKGNFGHKGCDHTCAPTLQGAVVQGINGGKVFLPFFQFAVEHNAVGIFEPADQMDRPGIAGGLSEHIEHGTDGSQPGAAGDDHQMLVPELLHGPSLAIWTPQKQGISGLFLEDDVGDLADGTDGKLQPSISLGRDGDGGLTDYGDGQLHELTMGGLGFGNNPEGPLMTAFFFDAQDGTSLRLNRIHHGADLLYWLAMEALISSTAADALLTVAEMEISSGQRWVQRPQPTHICSSPNRAL